MRLRPVDPYEGAGRRDGKFAWDYNLYQQVCSAISAFTICAGV